MRAKQIIHKAERKLLQQRVQAINNILWDNTVRLDRCRSRLAFLVTPSTTEKCTNFTNKVRESWHIKVKDREIHKFNRLMVKAKDRYLSHRVENTPLQHISCITPSYCQSKTGILTNGLLTYAAPPCLRPNGPSSLKGPTMQKHLKTHLTWNISLHWISLPKTRLKNSEWTSIGFLEVLTP